MADPDRITAFRGRKQTFTGVNEMAASDKKISELTALGAAPAADDYIEIVDISESLDADKNKRLTIANLFNQPSITSPTLLTPTVADLSNMPHTHANATGGGALSLLFYENEVVSYENDLVFP